MIELPESYTLAKQFNKELKGKVVKSVEAGHTPHKFTWFFGDKDAYDGMLRGKVFGKTVYHGGHVEAKIGDLQLDLAEGLNLKLLAPGEKRPPKRQLLIEFEDGSALVGSSQMYGAISLFKEGEYGNPYYLVGKEKPDPYSDAFDEAYFNTLLEGAEKLSAKAFLATEQRIPGVGNGVAQDILWRARINPKTKVSALADEEKARLFLSIKETLREMAELGGRDTEKDLYGKPGGYPTAMSKNNTLMVCPACGGAVRKEAYMGGSVYYCTACQPIVK